MNEEIVKKTQDSLGKIIGKKPPLTEKLLNRPPFKFLHDVLTSIIRQTGFMKGLFTDKELSSENITAKEDKVAFLQKAIDIAVHATGTKLSVRPSKIVAGLEAEKTNEFLQALAVAVEKKVDNEACVKKVLGGGGGDGESKSKDKDREKESRDNDRERSADRRKRRSDRDKGETSKKSSSSNKRVVKLRKKDKENRERGSSDKKDRDDKESRRHRDSSKDGRRESSRNRESSRDRKDKESSERRDDRKDEKKADRREEKREDRRERSGRHRRKEEEAPPQTDANNEESEDRKVAESKGDTEGHDEEQTANKIPRPASAKGSRRRHREVSLWVHPLPSVPRRPSKNTQGRRQAPDELEDDDGQSEKRGGGGNQEEEPAVPPQVEQSRRLARPSSARPAPPRVKRQDNAQESLTERVDSARTQRVENVIIDNAQHSDDDDNFMVEEGAQDPLINEREDTVAPPSEEDGQHGGLVKKILESKKEYDQSEQQQKSQTKTKIDNSSVNEATRHKEKEMVRKEVDKLRSSIQTLTRSANPLGKIMDYVQEDLHSMQKERDMWRAENKKLSEQIKKEMGVTDGSIEPLKATLAELEQAVADQLDLIAAVKHSIIENDDKITKMLSSVSRT